jgi:hypothetical protein
MMEPCKIWIEKCDAARMIEDEFGTDKALTYLIGEKFLDYLEAAERLPDFRAEVPAFVAEIKTIFEPWQLAEFLKTARQTEPFDPSIYDDDEDMVAEDFGDGFLDLAFDLVDGLGVHSRRQSDFFVLFEPRQTLMARTMGRPG